MLSIHGSSWVHDEHVQAQHKQPVKSMSEDIECRTTILTLGRTVTEAAVASARYTSSCPASLLDSARCEIEPWELD